MNKLMKLNEKIIKLNPSMALKLTQSVSFFIQQGFSFRKLSRGFWAEICKIYFSKYTPPAGNSLLPRFKAYQTRKWNNFQNNPISALSLPMNINQGFNATTSNSILNHPSPRSNIPTPGKQTPLTENNPQLPETLLPGDLLEQEQTAWEFQYLLEN